MAYNINRIKKCLFITYAIQGAILLLLIGCLVLSLLGVALPKLPLSFLGLYYLTNAIICGMYSNYVFGKTMKEAYPDFYEKVFTGFPLTRIHLAFPDNADPHFVQCVKRYFFTSMLVYRILFFQIPLIILIFYF